MPTRLLCHTIRWWPLWTLRLSLMVSNYCWSTATRNAFVVQPFKEQAYSWSIGGGVGGIHSHQTLTITYSISRHGCWRCRALHSIKKWFLSSTSYFFPHFQTSWAIPLFCWNQSWPMIFPLFNLQGNRWQLIWKQHTLILTVGSFIWNKIIELLLELPISP